MSVLNFQQFVNEKYNRPAVAKHVKNITESNHINRTKKSNVRVMDVNGIFKKRQLSDLNWNYVSEQLKMEKVDCKEYIVEANDAFYSAKVIAPNQDIAMKLWEAKFITKDWSNILGDKLNESLEAQPAGILSITEK